VLSGQSCDALRPGTVRCCAALCAGVALDFAASEFFFPVAPTARRQPASRAALIEKDYDVTEAPRVIVEPAGERAIFKGRREPVRGLGPHPSFL